MGLAKQLFGKLADGTTADVYTLSNDHGIEMKVTNYGGIVISLHVPDRNGNSEDIVLGHDTLEGYQTDSPYFGALIGRYGNRIAKGRFPLNGTEYQVASNQGNNHLHGGLVGFDKVLWDVQEAEVSGVTGLQLSYLSKDNEEGYPGNLSVTVTYSLTQNNEFRIDYIAMTDKTTVLNLTQHSYFNLSGDKLSNVLDCDVMINGDQFTEVDDELIPTGELKSVEGSLLDFRSPITALKRIEAGGTGRLFGGGYDHNWVLNNPERSLILAASIYEPTSGRMMETYTTEPGMQFYTGNYLGVTGKQGKEYKSFSGFCMETQHFPDSPNHLHFPSTVLKPGETYTQTTIYKFSTR